MSDNNTSYSSCFDVIGPIMVGPSSSHTAGAINIGEAARKVFNDEPQQAIITYYESFAETHKGHGTDFAIVSGILGFDHDDERVPYSVDIATEAGIDIQFIEMEGDSPFNHPNTADITLSNDHHTARVAGVSVGGGKIELRKIEIFDFNIDITGFLPALLIITDNNETGQRFTQLFEENQVVVTNTIHQSSDTQQLFYYEIQHFIPERITKAIAEMEDIIFYTAI